VRSAGTEQGARVKVSAGLIGWADLIFVMEKKHLRRLQDKFEDGLNGKRVITLHIPDEYTYMDEALIDVLKSAVSSYLTDIVNDTN